MNTGLRPADVLELEDVFGGDSQAGFGSAVFFMPVRDSAAGSLELESKSFYQRFCGDIWEEFGVENWLGTWKLLHERPVGGSGDIVAEIEGIRDPESGSAAQMLLDAGPDPDRAIAALRTAFNDPGITQLKIFKIGDGGSMSGAIIAAENNANVRLFLIILLD
ncbi:MAG: hypothetical protein Q8M16_06900 [Pirellulaceae bacterium]|nr:hypothetical protein [Pirellulaceae bacterium]